MKIDEGTFDKMPVNLQKMFCKVQKDYEEAGRVLDEQSGWSRSTKGKPRKSTSSGAGWGMTATGAEYEDAGGASRFFYCPKVSSKERNAGCETLEDKDWKMDGAAVPQRADRPFNPSKNNHPTVKPIALMEYLIRLVAPPGGVVLDPFLGSGSTAVAATRLGFRWVGCEKEADYAEIARARITSAEDELLEDL